MVARRPGVVRLVVVAPIEGQLEFRVTPEARSVRRVKGGGIGEAAIGPRRLGFLARPMVELSPDAHQALVRNIDHRLRLKRFASRGHQEGPTRIAEHIDDRDDFIFCRVGQRARVA